MHRIAAFRLVLATFLLASALPLLAPSVSPVAGQTSGPTCDESGPDGGAYTVEICLTASWTSSEQTGDLEIAASVEATSGAMPEIALFEFSLAKTPATSSFTILTDYASPYGLTLPTNRFVDGTYRISVEAEFVDDFDTEEAEITISFRNGVTREPVVNDSWEPTPGRPGSPFVLAAVGDGAGGLPGANRVGRLIRGWDPNMLLYLGDVYNAGTYTEFYNYYRPTLGRLKSITNPVPGNHEAGGSGFQGYFEYWDTHSHYYSVDAAGWHLIALDNTEVYRQTGRGTPQYDWLAQELAANADECTIVFMHYPRYGLGPTSDYRVMQPIWELLADNDVEIALTGHEHNYHRWQPLDRQGEVNPDGVTQFVVGTGGHELEPFRTDDARVVTGIEGRDGALRMILSDTGAEFEFIATDGTVLDSGSIPCTVSGAMTLSKLKSKPDGRVEADLRNFTPGSEITLRWEDGRELGTGTADDEGRAQISFRTPSVPYGTYQVTAQGDDGVTASAAFAVIPRITPVTRAVVAGDNLQVDLAGFSADKTVEIRFSADGGESYEVLGTVTTNENGSATTVVTIPASASSGAYRLTALPSTGERRSASEMIEVTAANATPEPDS